jgi:hypothetical protein
MNDTSNRENSETKFVRRQVPADLVEATPAWGALGHWVLASPLLIYLAWFWIDLFTLFSPLPYWINLLLGLLVYVGLLVLPLGYLAHRFVLFLPRLFHNAGWDIEPLEPVKLAEQYMVRYQYKQRHWATNNWPRAWMRAAQGWVYLEIAAILIGALVLIPIFFSVTEFGFGR